MHGHLGVSVVHGGGGEPFHEGLPALAVQLMPRDDALHGDAPEEEEEVHAQLVRAGEKGGQSCQEHEHLDGLDGEGEYAHGQPHGICL
jgi:hypothetical protein